MTEYICQRTDLFEKLHDPVWFIEFIDVQYKQIFSTEQYVPKISEFQSHQAQERWVTDIENIKHKENGGRELDHFKLAAHLAFWLKRFSPIASFQKNADLAIAGVKLRDNGDYIYSYGNTQAAFLIGFDICAYWEAVDEKCSERYGENLTPFSFSIKHHPDFLQNMSYVLADKSSSPHALYLIYKALFANVLIKKS